MRRCVVESLPGRGDAPFTKPKRRDTCTVPKRTCTNFLISHRNFLASTAFFAHTLLKAAGGKDRVRFQVILNGEGGTLRTMDLDGFSDEITTALQGAGHQVDIDIVKGAEIESALKKASRRRGIDVIMVGGGDGTVSAAAATLMDTGKVLAILPAGTMNLFARSLGIPQDLKAAITALAQGEVREVDVASANGKPFVHQFSIGLHAKMVHLRDRMEFSSRLGKIGASFKAAYRTVLRPPALKVKLSIGDAEIVARTSGVGVSNNLFGEGHLPYADTPDGGVLGIYVTIARERWQLLRYAINAARGKWRDNDQVEIHEAESVTVTLPGSYKRYRCVIDGELCDLKRSTTLKIHKKALRVLTPTQETAASAA